MAGDLNNRPIRVHLAYQPIKRLLNSTASNLQGRDRCRTHLSLPSTEQYCTEQQGEELWIFQPRAYGVTMCPVG